MSDGALEERVMKQYGWLLLLVWGTPSYADIQLPKIIASHMVLQRNSTVTIWGWATPQERIAVKGDWMDAPVHVRADPEGNWAVRIRTEEAGASHTIIVSGNNRIVLEDILFGEVWLASGQSNMEMPLINVSSSYTGILQADQEVAAARYPGIRLFQVGNFSSKTPLEDVQSGILMYGVPLADCRWQACALDTVATFSSTAYFFARMLHWQLKVPIGIIDASWGGTSAEVWTPEAGLKQLGLESYLQQASELPQEPSQKIPTRLFNGMIHPLRDFQIKGVIWYQGESNVSQANQYRDLFSIMIRRWRDVFGYEFPFYFVQIAPYDYVDRNAAYLREAQLQTLSVSGTGMVVTMDIGNRTDIHPRNKQEVGRRLALWALAKDYARKVDYSGPLFREAIFDGGEARVTFDHVGKGLATNDGESPSDFQIAGQDRVFYPGIAVIEGEEIVVISGSVPEPQAVRYGFTSQAMPNLVNRSGLPASPFRSDSWKFLPLSVSEK